MTGEGVEQFIRAVREGRAEYEREYRQAGIFVTKIRCFLSRKTEQFEVLLHLKVPFFQFLLNTPSSNFLQIIPPEQAGVREAEAGAGGAGHEGEGGGRGQREGGGGGHRAVSLHEGGGRGPRQHPPGTIPAETLRNFCLPFLI